jgi:predicted porin
MQRIAFALVPALLALTAFDARAQASSVTIYGVMDATAQHGKGSLNKVNGLGSGGHTTSRLGFRGEEDLGGGVKADFWLEAQVFVDTGAGQPTNTNNQTSGAGTGSAMSFARRSTVSLMGGFGEVRLGRDFTAHYRNRVEVDPFGNAGVGAAQPFAGSIGGLVSTRASNMLAYFLPANLGGVYGQVQHYRGENTSGTATSGDGTGSTLRLGYRNGGLNVSLAHGRTTYATTATLGDITSSNLGAQVDFGVLKLMAGLYRDKMARTAPQTAKGWTLGATAPLGAHLVRASVSRYGTDAGIDPTTTKLAAGYVYSLSKRTAIYTTVARVKNSGGATAALNASTTAADQSSTGLDIGVRHAF